MNEFSIDDSRTRVQGVRLTKYTSTGAQPGDCYLQTKVNGSWLGNPASGCSFIDGTLEKTGEDTFKVKSRTGVKDEVEFIITESSIQQENSASLQRFTKKHLTQSSSSNKNKSFSNEKSSSNRGFSFRSRKKANGSNSSSSSSDEEGYCKKLLLTIVLVLPIWWIIKLPFSILFYPFRKISSSSKNAQLLPHYSLKKF